MRLLSWAIFVLAIWVLVTPWIGNAAWLSVVLGAVMAILSLIAAIRKET